MLVKAKQESSQGQPRQVLRPCTARPVKNLRLFTSDVNDMCLVIHETIIN